MNSSLLTSDCSELCCCSASTGLSCHPTGCPSGQVCKLQEGVRSCQPAHGVCSITVGANLTTFDGAHNAISSPGVYELSSRCPGIQKPVPWYRVVADVQSCNGNDKVVDKVHIFFEDGLVTVTRSNGVWVSLGTEGKDVFPGLSFFLSRYPTSWLSSGFVVFPSSRSPHFFCICTCL